MSAIKNPIIEYIVKCIKDGNLTLEERLAVVQDVGLIKKYYKYDNVTLLNGLEKINKSIKEDTDTSYSRKFRSYINESIKTLRVECADILMKPILESDDIKKNEGESDADFKKRKEEQDKIEKKNVDEFEKAKEKMKKGETKPLAKALRAKGMSQQELADQLDVHKSTISRLKTGKRNPSFEMMADLGETLGSVENLFPELK